MIRIILLIIATSFLLFSCKTETKKVEENLITTEIETPQIPLLTLGEFNTKAGAFVNKEVKIQGIVDHVCKHSGKKLLVVTDEGDVHITSDVRFEDSLKGSEILLTGVVVEQRIDEAYCLQMEEDNIKSHSEGTSNNEEFNNKKKHVQQLRDQMKAEKVDHISNYSLQYVSHKDVVIE